MSRAVTHKQSRNACRVRRYEQGDEERIIRVLETVFNGWPAFDLLCEPIDHWRWRYLEFPGNSDHIFICESGNKIVGCLHHTGIGMKIGERIYPGSLAGDIAILKPFRDRGLLAEFTKAAMQRRNETGDWFTFFETPNPKLVHYFRKAAFQLPIQSRHLVRVRSINRHLSKQGYSGRWLKVCVFKLLQAFNRVVHRPPATERPADLVVSEMRDFDSRFDVFWDQIASHYTLIVQRDRRYLNWRFGDSRAGDYLLRCAEDDGGIVGYIVLRINRKDRSYPTGYVVDLLCQPGRDDAASVMISDALRYFDQRAVPVVHCLVPRKHPYRKIFAAHGFVDTLERTIVFLLANRPMGGQIAALDLMDPGQFYYSYGDIDSI